MVVRSPVSLALVVEYDGARYHGFQVQVGVPTIQGEIERALTRVTGERIRITGAGRTDAGVHAEGQVVSFRLGSDLPLQVLIKALNFYLAEDISVKAGSEAINGFSARKDAISREYRYTIWNSPARSPLKRSRTCFVPRTLDSDAMNEASQSLVGTHDFASFSAAMAGRTTRTVSRADVSRMGEIVQFDIVANAFLPKQVRLTVGCLMDVGLGKLSVEGFREILQARRTGSAGRAASADGLCLMKVNYPEHKLSIGQVDENVQH
jgi:tRNA pseudouridine38-40 synthase